MVLPPSPPSCLGDVIDGLHRKAACITTILGDCMCILIGVYMHLLPVNPAAGLTGVAGVHAVAGAKVHIQAMLEIRRAQVILLGLQWADVDAKAAAKKKGKKKVGSLAADDPDNGFQHVTDISGC